MDSVIILHLIWCVLIGKLVLKLWTWHVAAYKVNEFEDLWNWDDELI